MRERGRAGGREVGGGGARWTSRKLLLEWMEALSTGYGEWKRGAKFGNWKATRLIEAATKRERQKIAQPSVSFIKENFSFEKFRRFHSVTVLKKRIYAPITSTSKVNYSNITAQSLAKGDPFLWNFSSSFDGWLLAQRRRRDGNVFAWNFHVATHVCAPLGSEFLSSPSLRLNTLGSLQKNTGGIAPPTTLLLPVCHIHYAHTLITSEGLLDLGCLKQTAEWKHLLLRTSLFFFFFKAPG